MSSHFTPFASFLGGALIGLAAVLMFAFAGRIAGISGIVVRALTAVQDGAFAGRLAFIIGLVVAPLTFMLVMGRMPTATISTGPAMLVIAGLLVGFGSVWGNGCTSGHGICGLSRLSVRSLAAVLTFMATAIITVFVMRHLV
jgi:uncharacterized protein